MRRTRAIFTALVVAGALTACGSSTAPGAGGTGSAGAPSGHLTVLAAASLKESFTELGRRFEAAHPGTTVTFSFGASSSLAQQIRAGAPADVYAAASPATMTGVVTAGDAAAPTTFATNSLEIAVPPGNPAHVTGLADLARPGVRVVLCAAAVPCGSLARTVLATSHLDVTPVSLEADVKATLAKVTLGEADAALVYRTDVKAAGPKVRGIEIPAASNGSTAYPIAVLTRAPNPALARAFAGYVASPEARTVLAAAGFGAP